MTHDPERVSEVRAWIVKAVEDLRAAEVLLKLEEPLNGVALFHAQQAAEKAMKGFLCWHDQPLKKTHNLIPLGKSCVQIDASLEAFLRPAAKMTDYAWQYRYPGEPAEPEIEEALEAVSIARVVIKAVLDRLPSDIAIGISLT